MAQTASATPDMPDTPVGLRLTGLSVTLTGGKRLFDDLTLDITGGQTTCLLGPSGIGKSMLLRLMLGLTCPGDGVISDMDGTIEALDGRAIADRVAYMGQSDNLMPWLSVERNVHLGASLRGATTEAVQAIARSLLADVGLADVADDDPATLSGGMRQRVALARTLFEDRPVVCMDEPFSKLDALTRLRLQTLAAEQLRGRTVIVVTHDPLEALRLAHHIVVLGDTPARIVGRQSLAGLPPRDAADPSLTAQQASLLEALGVGAPDGGA